MPCSVPRTQNGPRIRFAACLLALAGVAGCGTKTSPAKQRLDRELKENPEFRLPEPVARFAGRVTVDGKPPRKDCRLFVILNDPDRLAETPFGETPKRSAICDADGNFALTTNEPRDGVVPGKYIVTFVELHPLPMPIQLPAGHLRVPLVSSRPRYGQPDELRSLYSDPEKNSRSESFNLDIELPGRDDYHFDLIVGGQEPIRAPAPNALRPLPVR
jgi:hypothetical protein